MDKDKIFYWVICVALFIMTLTMIIPILNIAAISFSSPEKLSEVTGLTVIPKGFSIINYKVLLSNPKILKSLFQ